MGTGDLFSSVRTFPQHPCDVSPLPCAQYRSLLLLLRSLFSVFPGVSSSTFRLSLSPSLSFFLSFRSTRLRCHSLRCTPFRPNNLADRRRTNVEPLLVSTAGSQNGRRLGIYFFRGPSRDIFLPSCICSLHLFLSFSPLLLVHRVTPPLCFERNIRPTRIRDDDGTPLYRR